jgi:hypothetical protein
MLGERRVWMLSVLGEETSGKELGGNVLRMNAVFRIRIT